MKNHMWGFLTSVPDFFYKRWGIGIVAINIISFPPSLGSQVTVYLPIFLRPTCVVPYNKWGFFLSLRLCTIWYLLGPLVTRFTLFGQ